MDDNTDYYRFSHSPQSTDSVHIAIRQKRPTINDEMKELDASHLRNENPKRTFKADKAEEYITGSSIKYQANSL